MPGRPAVTRGTALRLDPVRRLLYYLVETTAPGVRLFTQIDAATGAVLSEWNALETADGMGTGVKGDRKSLTGGDPLVTVGAAFEAGKRDVEPAERRRPLHHL